MTIISDICMQAGQIYVVKGASFIQYSLNYIKSAREKKTLLSIGKMNNSRDPNYKFMYPNFTHDRPVMLFHVF